MDVNLTITGEIERLHVGPNDALVVKLIADHPIHEEDFVRVQHLLRQRLSGVEWIDRVIIVDGKTVELSVVEGAKP